jgi:hypothetical protein
MITIRLLGGLGNTMFQYAFSLSLKERGYDVQLDKSALVEGTHREYSLEYFGIKANGRSTGREVYEHGMRYNPSYLEPTDDCTMVGYWQTEKYFENIADKIREKFQFQGIRVRYPHTIALHVRRQDYVGLQHYHGMPSLEYYREAVAHIRRRAAFNCPVLVFSDDKHWCRENLPSDFEISEGNDKYADLKLMASCDYHVIANSSYSWWGAWLSGQKLVVAPKQWFTEPEIDYSDIVPERWVKL